MKWEVGEIALTGPVGDGDKCDMPCRIIHVSDEKIIAVPFMAGDPAEPIVKFLAKQLGVDTEYAQCAFDPKTLLSIEKKFQETYYIKKKPNGK